MSSEEKGSGGYKGIAQLLGKRVYEPVRKYFAPMAPSQSGRNRPSVEQPLPPSTANTKAARLTSLPDGAKLAYEILGSQHLGKATPIVFICGMTAVRGDSDRTNGALAKSHPVLVYDHRGMGDSSLSHSADEEITIELLARDLLYLLTQLKWKEVVICGHSMGGVIAQQFLVLPYHPTNPARIPFRITHLFLIGTRCKVHQAVGLPLTAVPGTPRSLEERREGARRVLAASLDPAWVEANSARFEHIFGRVVNNNLSNRPADMIAKQGAALRKFDFERLLKHIPRDVQVLIIHGHLDKVVPFQVGQEILAQVPWAKLVDEGPQPGQVPTLQFGHLWYEYFDPQVWHDVLHTFIQRPVGPSAKD